MMGCGSAGKESACNAGDLSSIPGLGRSTWEDSWEKRLPTPVIWPGEFHELYSPWGHKELDTTEQLSLSRSVTSFFSSQLARTYNKHLIVLDENYPEGKRQCHSLN